MINKIIDIIDNHTPIWLKGQNRNIKIIVVLVVGSLLWMMTGIFNSHHKVAEEIKPIMKVKVMDSTAQPHSFTISYLGIAEPIQVINIRPETEGTVISISAQDGQFLKHGDVIAELDKKFYNENLRIAQAQLSQEKVNFASSKALYEKKLSSTSAFYNAQKQINAAESAVSKAKDDLRKTVISAPFDGYIGNISIHVGDVLSAFQENRVAQFFDISQFKITLNVPQKDVEMLGNAKEVLINHNNGQVKCNVSYLSKLAYSATRAFRFEATCDNKDYKVLAYENVRADVILKPNEGLHYIPKSSLILETNGEISIKTVDENNTVKSFKVDIVDEDNGGFWVSNLPEKVKILTLGQQFVIENEKVDLSLLTQ